MDNQEYIPEQPQKTFEWWEFEIALFKYNDSRLKKAQIVAYLPIVGWLGVHDFIIGRKDLGFMRLFLLPTLIIPWSWIFLWVWSASEGNQIARFRKNREIENPPSAEMLQSLYASYYNKTHYAIISFILTIIPILLWVYCLAVLANATDRSENGEGVVMWLIVFYYGYGGIIVYIVSVIFGFKGLKTKLYLLSIISLTMKIIAIICIIIFMRLFWS